MDNVDEITDAHLMARSQEDPDSFTRVYDRHARAVFRYVASRLGGEAADDVTSDTFLVAFERRDRYDPAHSSSLPWLLGIATRLIRRRRRDEIASWRAVAAVGGLGGAGSPHLLDDPHEELDARLDAEAEISSIAHTIAKLPQRDRDVLTLTAWSDLDSAGIAEALGIPIGTVRSRLHRARRILRTQLAAGPARDSETDHERV